MNFEIHEAKQENEKEIIKNLMQLYTYELSFFVDETTNFKLLDNGLYELSKYLELYWKEEERHPYILKCNGKLAGYNSYGAKAYEHDVQISNPIFKANGSYLAITESNGQKIYLIEDRKEFMGRKS